MATRPASYPITSDMNTSVARVKQILAGQEKTMFLQYITETYETKYKETLPKNWCIDVKNSQNSGLTVDNPCKGVWTVMLTVGSNTHSNRNGSINNSNSPRRSTQQYHELNSEQQLRHPPNYQAQQIKPHQVEQQITQQQTSYSHVPPISPVECRSPYKQTQQVKQKQMELKINLEQTSSHYAPPMSPVECKTPSLTSEDSFSESSLPPLTALMIGLNLKDTSNESQESVQIPALKMPESNFWDVYCTYIKDCNNIYFRFIGEVYSNAYDDLVTDMELYYMEEKNLSPVTTPTFGAVYAASHDESWYRVQLLGLDGDEASVMFIDHGDREVISVKNLHHLKNQFGKLPAQGVQCSLAGLDFAPLDGSTLIVLQQMALGKPLVAQVMSRNIVTSVVLFDTSTNDDININEKICEQLENSFSEPHFPYVGGVAEIYVSHATPTGDIYVQIETETFKVLENIMDIIRSTIKDAWGKN
ncbi:unnamed protein product [Meganyctiphanes norvegica]|uniref:Tudor domain-containing protein n=1 Tax=Meganyctiphanes norvegica TaxID=48144 RepID=A0AAV2RIN3_MEGNR